MGLVEAFLRERKCPTDGGMLHGKELVCNTCRSTWRPLFEGDGASDGLPFDNREYLRRKLKELSLHALQPGKLAPMAASRQYLAGGTGTTRLPGRGPSFGLAGDTLAFQKRAHLLRRVVDGAALNGKPQAMPLLKTTIMPGASF